MRVSKREFLTSVTLGILFLSGCSAELDESESSKSDEGTKSEGSTDSDKVTDSKSDEGANLTLTNASDESVQIAVTITDEESGRALLRDSYRVAASDDGRLVEGVVATTGSYHVEAVVENTGASASSGWRIPSDADPEDYPIRIGFLSDGGLRISGDGIRSD